MLILILLYLTTRQGALDHYKDGEAVYGDEDQPLNPDGLALVLQEAGPDIQQDDTQAVQRVVHDAEVNEDLEAPILIDNVDRSSDIATELLHGERGNHMSADKDKYPQPSDTVQKPGEHGPPTFIRKAL